MQRIIYARLWDMCTIRKRKMKTIHALRWFENSMEFFRRARREFSVQEKTITIERLNEENHVCWYDWLNGTHTILLGLGAFKVSYIKLAHTRTIWCIVVLLMSLAFFLLRLFYSVNNSPVVQSVQNVYYFDYIYIDITERKGRAYMLCALLLCNTFCICFFLLLDADVQHTNLHLKRRR